jgi:hypothetical protein
MFLLLGQPTRAIWQLLVAASPRTLEGDDVQFDSGKITPLATTLSTAAGATIAQVYETQFYDDDLRLRLMNETMKKITGEEKLPNLW